jgi:hypothetical protein
LIPTATLLNVRKLKGDCQRRAGEFYQLAQRAREKDDALTRDNDTNGALNTHLGFVYGLIEDIIESVNAVDDKVNQLHRPPDLKAAKKQLRPRVKKDARPSRAEIKEYEECNGRGRKLYG